MATEIVVLSVYAIGLVITFGAEAAHFKRNGWAESDACGCALWLALVWPAFVPFHLSYLAFKRWGG